MGAAADGESSPGRGRVALRLRGWQAVLVLLPFLPSLLFILGKPWPEASVDDDNAVMEMYTLHAARGAQLVGPYSRFGWNHPGPAEFYWLLPFYVLSGEKTAAISLGSLFLSLTVSIAIVHVAGRLGGTRSAWWTLALLSALLAEQGPSRIASSWGPHVTVLPFALFLLLCAGFVLRGVTFLPFLVLVGSFLVQTHVSYVPSVAALCVASLALRWRAMKHGPSPGPGRPGPWWTASVALLVLLWAPPLVEELQRRPGNLSSLATFFLSHRSSHEFSEIFLPMSRQLSAMPLKLASLFVPSTSDQKGLGTGFLTLLLVALLPLASSLAIRKKGRCAGALGLLSVVALAAAFWSVAKIHGPVLDYLVLWTAVPGFVGWLAIGGAFLEMQEQARHGRSWVLALLALAVLALATVQNIRRVSSEPPVWVATIRPVQTISDSLKAYLKESRVERPLFRIATHDTWVPAAGILLQLYKAKIPFAVEEDWFFMFGRQFQPTGHEGKTLLLGDHTLDLDLRARPDYQRVAASADTVVYALEDPTWVERHLYHGTARVVGAEKTIGDPALVGDGRFPPEGTVWNEPACLVLAGANSWVTLEKPVSGVIGLLISADHNDTYRVLGSSDGKTFEEMGAIQPVAGSGMRRRVLCSERLERCRYLRIVPQGGDGAYSLGEVGFLINTP